MKPRIVLSFLLFLPCLGFTQDLELDVHVLPTSIIGDPALFNVTVRNKGEEPVQGVEVKIVLEDGLEFSSFTKKNLDFDPELGIWRIGEVTRYKAQVLGIIAKYAKRDNAILSAEVTKSSGMDPDSTPGNGVDTNGNGKIVNDKGDEDDGDAAQNGPYN